MKQTFIFLAALLGFSLNTTVQQAKVLVTYFSATGSTQAIAEKIAQQTGGDLFAIAPEVPYTAADLDWTDKSSRCVDEMLNHPERRPAILPFKGNIADYDVVFVGYPIWWAVAPTVVNLFIESVKLNSKRVVPFATSYSSAGEKSYSELRKAYPKIQWGEGWLSKQGSTKGLTEWVSKSIQ